MPAFFAWWSPSPLSHHFLNSLWLRDGLPLLGVIPYNLLEYQLWEGHKTMALGPSCTKGKQEEFTCFLGVMCVKVSIKWFLLSLLLSSHQKYLSTTLNQKYWKQQMCCPFEWLAVASALRLEFGSCDNFSKALRQHKARACSQQSQLGSLTIPTLPQRNLSQTIWKNLWLKHFWRNARPSKAGRGALGGACPPKKTRRTMMSLSKVLTHRKSK